MALGDKVVDFQYYGLTYRDWTIQKSGVYESNPVAKLVQKDTWDGYYVDPNTYPYTPYPDMQGTELNETVGLWRIQRAASFNPCTFCVAASSTLNYIALPTEADEDKPLAIQVTNVSSYDYPAFSTNPPNRLAYNQTSRKGWERSALIADIPYYNYCMSVAVYCYDSTTNQNSATSLNSLAAYIDADATHRSVIYLRPILNYGTEIPRIVADTSNAQYINEIDGSISREGVPIADVLTVRKIPENAPNIRSRIKDNHNDWKDDEIYAPFGFNPAFDWYATETGNTDQVHRIGLYARYTVNNVINGAGFPGIERGRFFRCNFSEKLFDDVCYKWDLCCLHEASGRFLNNGYDLTTLSGSSYLRFFTKLVITDRKGNTEGQALVNAILHEMAFIGFYFTQTSAIATNTDFLTDDLTGVYLPILFNGVTTGLYTTGNDIKNQPNWNADSINNSAFNYNPEGDAGGYDIGDFQSVLNSGAISAGTIYYAVSDTEFKDLVRYLNTTYNPDEDQLAADFKGVNPFDYITSVKYYPFPLPYAVSQEINVGPLATGVTGYIMPYTYGNPAYSYFDFGSYTFTPRYGNFLDYSATKITLYLPWCGSMQLDPALWIAAPGYPPITIKIKYSFDYVTGSVTAFIFRCTSQGDFLFTTADGQAGIDVPLSLYATGTYQQQIMQAQASYKQAAGNTAVTALGLVGAIVGTAVSAAVGFAPGVVGGLGGIGTSLHKLNQSMIAEDAVSYTLDHTQPTLGNVSAASPFNAAITDQRPFILISRPKLQPGLPINWEADYAHTVGYACTVPMQLSQARGFTVVQSSKLEGIKKTIGTQTFTPTKQEIQLIKQQLAAGVIF